MQMLTRREMLMAAAGIPAFHAGLPATNFPTTVASRVERAFRSPGANPNGLQATREGLWVLDQGTNQAALLRYDDGGVIRQLATETDRGSGITFDGAALWIASTYNRLLVKVDAQSGKTLRQLPSPGSGVVKWGPRSGTPRASGGAAGPSATGAHGLEWRRGELWVAAPPAVTIFVVNPEDGAVLRSFPAPGVRPHGIGWDPDGSLWCAESIYRSFFKMDPQSGRILKQLMLPPAAPEVNGVVVVPHGMTIWNRQVWFSVAETGEIYRLPLA